MGILSFGMSDIGQKRKTNQDAVYINKQHNIFMVADGMGGHNGGDIASQLTVKAVPQFFTAHLDADPVATMKSAVYHGNTVVHQHSLQNAVLKGMGTTLNFLHFRETKAHIANVGDSRCYLICQKKLFQLSRDHSLVQEKLFFGVYDRKQAQNDPMKNVLTRSVGFEESVEVDLYTYKVARNDLFLVCSDGLHSKVSDQNIIEIINHFIPDPRVCTQQDINRAVQFLVHQANANGGQDNISIILALAR